MMEAQTMSVTRKTKNAHEGWLKDGSLTRTIIRQLDPRDLRSRTVYFWTTTSPDSYVIPAPYCTNKINILL
jgi:hypothetical protein